MNDYRRRVSVGLLLGTFQLAGSAQAQSGLTQAVLALDKTAGGDVRTIDGRMFGARIDARIIDENGIGSDFAPNDRIDFRIWREGLSPLEFSSPNHTRAEFEQWAQDNAAALLDIIFPSSLSAAVLGRDAAQIDAQQLMASTILNIAPAPEPGSPRRKSGGLIEFESFAPPDEQLSGGGTAWQGTYSFGRFVAVHGRFSKRREDLPTKAVSAAVDFHPYKEIEGLPVELRVGVLARAGFIYSKSAAFGSSDGIHLASIDAGGGGWVAVRKDFSRVRVGGGTLVQGTKSTMPFSDGSNWGFIANLLNERGVVWDVSYGGTVAVDTTRSTSLVVKYLETRSMSTSVDRPTLRLALIGYSFALGHGTALDAGYKITSSGGLRSGAIFLQGSFGW